MGRFRFRIISLLGLTAIVAIVLSVINSRKYLTVSVFSESGKQPIRSVEFLIVDVDLMETTDAIDESNKWTRMESRDGRFSLYCPKNEPAILLVRAVGFIDARHRIPRFQDSWFRRQLSLVLYESNFIKGTVRDIDGNPIPGAVISPIVFQPPIFTPDVSRSVQSNELGQFEVDGVNVSCGIHISHGSFLNNEMRKKRSEVASGEGLIWNVILQNRAETEMKQQSQSRHPTTDQ